MNLLFLSDVSLENPSSGSEQVLYRQAQGLLKNNFKINAITRENKKSFNSGVRYIDGILDAYYSINLKQKPLIFLSILAQPYKLFEKFIAEKKLTVAIGHQPFTLFSLLISGKLKNLPLIYIFHSPSYEEYLLSQSQETYFLNKMNIILRKFVEGLCLKRASKVMVLSKYMKQKAMNLYGISHRQIIVNPGGVDLEKFYPPNNRKRALKEIGFLKEKINLLTVRNLEPRMGIDNLLIAIKLLKKTPINIHLTIVGEGPERKRLEHLIKESELTSDVTLAGFIPSNRLSLYYGAADLFILPTRELEGFGLVTPESMACGTPVLGTPVGGTKEILKRFDSQFLFNNSTPDSMADGIQRAIDVFFKDKVKYDRLRTRCREFVVQNYSWQRHIDQLALIIDELIEIDDFKH
jgi:glycosyltransferase involved in cell wall biosynthesis